MRRVAVGQLLTLAIAAALWRGGAPQLLQPNGKPYNYTEQKMFLPMCIRSCISPSPIHPLETAEIVIAHQTSTVLEGNTVLLTCVALGMPNPDVVWQKDGVDLMNSTRNNIYFNQFEVGGVVFVQATLEICSVELGDAGLYSCYASNEYGADTQSFEITVDPIS